ncbi:hypothetical protein NIES4073_36750 [Kalymmatonema gypsitolerans NIES-4073]|nr:hypothetical protein NIES4073_36750 [Scytonema sp. NIES-4073]
MANAYIGTSFKNPRAFMPRSTSISGVLHQVEYWLEAA